MEHRLRSNWRARTSRKRENIPSHGPDMQSLEKQRTPTSVSPLLAVPAEIRNLIYSHIFTPSDSDDPALPGTRARDLLQPLLTCRQIYEEAHALAFHCVTFALEAMARLKLKERASLLQPNKIRAIQSMAYSNYLGDDGYNHRWLQGLSHFRPDQCGIMLDELVLRPAWEDEKILPLISREGRGNHMIMDRGRLRDLRNGVLVALRNIATLKRIVIYCDGLLFERDIAALHEEFMCDWRQNWDIIIRDPRQWTLTLLTYEGGAQRERSVTIEFRMSDSWVGYYFPPLPLSADSQRFREIHFLRHNLQEGFLSPHRARTEEEMMNMSRQIQNLETYTDLEVRIIRGTKIHRVLKAIIKLDSIPADEIYDFRGRLINILGKWENLLYPDSPSTRASPSTADEKNSDAKPTS